MEGRIKRRQKRDSNEKRKTRETTNNEDHFSKLPESIIIYILSFLEMKDVVKTSLLSKSWENIWTKAYNVVLRMPYQQTNDSWLSSVDETIMRCNADIDKFCFICNCYSYDFMDKWTKEMLDRKVKILKLTSSDNITGRVFQSSTVTEMELVGVGLMFVMSSSPVSLSSLKSLLLDLVEAEDEFIEKIVMGSPVLESFVLINAYDNHVIKIMSPSVKRFKLCDFRDETDGLVIEAPWIKELEISGGFDTIRCQLVNVSCLIKATLIFKVQYSTIVGYEMNKWAHEAKVEEYNDLWIPMAGKLMSSVAYVEELTIGSHPIQALYICKVSGTPSPLFKCKRLSIQTCLWKFDLPGIICLLENAPQLETLFIKVLDDDQNEFPIRQTRTLFQFDDPHLGAQKGKFLHLKNVKIEYVRSSCHDAITQSHGKMFDFELVEYIVKSAVVLDKLVLCSSRSRCLFSRCPAPSCSLLWVRSLSCKLIRTLLRVKKAADWDVNKNNDMNEFTFQNHASLHPTSSSP